MREHDDECITLCPSCEEATISIAVQTFAYYYSDEDVETYGNIEFDDTSAAFCRSCGWMGTVGDVRMGEEEEDNFESRAGVGE